jgi:hypothetical protein
MVRKLPPWLAASTLVLFAYGCGTQSPPAVGAALTTCPTSAPGTTAGNWDGKVSGISCAAAGQFIEQHGLSGLHRAYKGKLTLGAIPHSKPGRYRSAGFTCDFAPFRKGNAGWHVSCAHSQQRLSFSVFEVAQIAGR